jgi:hypothetical protein
MSGVSFLIWNPMPGVDFSMEEDFNMNMYSKGGFTYGGGF